MHSVMEQILISMGGNNYKMPHKGKDKMDSLPVTLPCCPVACQVALDALMFV